MKTYYGVWFHGNESEPAGLCFSDDVRNTFLSEDKEAALELMETFNCRLPGKNFSIVTLKIE